MKHLRWISSLALGAVLLSACATGATNNGSGAAGSGTTTGSTTEQAPYGLGTSTTEPGTPMTGGETTVATSQAGGTSGTEVSGGTPAAGTGTGTPGIPVTGPLSPTASGNQATQAAGTSGNLPNNAQPAASGFVRVKDLLDYNVVAGTVPVGGSSDTTLLEQQLGSVMDLLVPVEKGSSSSNAPVYLVVMTTSASGSNQASGQLVAVPLNAVESQIYPERKVIAINVTEQQFQQAPRFVNQAFPDMTRANWDENILAYWSKSIGSSSGSNSGAGSNSSGSNSGAGAGSSTPTVAATESVQSTPVAPLRVTNVPATGQPTAGVLTPAPTTGASGSGASKNAAGYSAALQATATPVVSASSTPAGTAQPTVSAGSSSAAASSGNSAAQAASVTYLRATTMLRTDFTVVLENASAGTGANGSGSNSATATPAASGSGVSATATPTASGSTSAATSSVAANGSIGKLEDMVIYVGLANNASSSTTASSASANQNQPYLIIRLDDGSGSSQGKLVAVPLSAATVDVEGAQITINQISSTELQSAPSFDEQAWKSMTGEAFDSQVGSFWNNKLSQ